MHFPQGVDVAASNASRLLEPECCGQPAGPPWIDTRTFTGRSLDPDSPTVLLDAETFSMERGWRTNYAHGFVEEFMAILERDGGGFFPDVIMTDPPRHTRVRKLMEQAFTAHRVKSLEAGITERVVRFIDGLPDAGEIDGINDLAMPLSRRGRLVCAMALPRLRPTLKTMAKRLPAAWVRRWLKATRRSG